MVTAGFGVFAGYTGSILVKNSKLAEILAELQVGVLLVLDFFYYFFKVFIIFVAVDHVRFVGGLNVRNDWAWLLMLLKLGLMVGLEFDCSEFMMVWMVCFVSRLEYWLVRFPVVFFFSFFYFYF